MKGFVCLVLFGLCLVFSEGKLTAEPKNSVVKPGSTVNLQWDFDDEMKIVVSRTWRFFGDSRILGVISLNRDPDILDQSLTFEIKKRATLVLKNVNESYNGTYQFTLETKIMKYVSEAVVVIAMTPTVTVECSRSKTMMKGDNITCMCKGKGGNPPAKVTWYKGGERITESGEEEQTLTLKNVGKNDGGRYRCLAFGHELAQNETTIELLVQFLPENVRVVFTPEMAERGKQFVIKCEAEANPPPTFKIFLNETEVPISGDTYTIPKVNDSHVGSYECVANNTLGSRSSTSRYLRVGNAETHGDDDGGLGTGAIVGIVIGVLVFVLIIVLVYLFVFKKKNSDHERVRSESNRATEQPPEQLTYAALDKKALKQGAGGKPASTSTPTEYAAIQVS